ncbi:MAG TPA: FecR domain-containing protein [Polyangiaceae bacterium]|nr:FecR domain-containing protein [Polyangiaceae bacterium]
MLQRWGARRLGWLLAAAALCGGVVWLAALPLSEQQGGAVTSAGTARSLTLPDRSTLALAEHTEARVVRLEPGEVRVQLARGSVECEVAHDPARRFVVAVGGLEVVVKGTHFTVSAGVPAPGQPAIAVSVERGRVEVRQPDRVLALLGPGQRWSNQASDSAPSELPPAEPPPVPPAAVEPSTPAPAAAPRPPPAPRARQRFEVTRARKTSELCLARKLAKCMGRAAWG